MDGKRTRVSLIDFLNAAPLQWGFTNGSMQGRFDLIFDVPSSCAGHLREREADIGLIPVVEYQRIPDLTVLPGISIASKREVRSVLFVSSRPIQEVQRIAVDASSRTSVALLRILLSEFYGNHEALFFETPPRPQDMLREYEAALVIGNPALHVDSQGLTVYDLAREWHRFTQLPFVFAFWAVAGNADLKDGAELFYRSREEGLARIEPISRVYAARTGLTREEVRSYLTRNLDYTLDKENLQGLKLFFRLAAKWKLIDEARPIVFYGGGEEQDACDAPTKGNRRVGG